MALQDGTRCPKVTLGPVDGVLQSVPLGAGTAASSSLDATDPGDLGQFPFDCMAAFEEGP